VVREYDPREIKALALRVQKAFAKQASCPSVRAQDLLAKDRLTPALALSGGRGGPIFRRKIVSPSAQTRA
jgi:hypothetical protein